MSDRLQILKRKVKAVVVQGGHRTVQFSLDIGTAEGLSDLAALEGSLRKKSKNVADRIDTTREVNYERKYEEMEWETIGDESPLKNGETVQVFLSENKIGAEPGDSPTHIRQLFASKEDNPTGNSLYC